MVSLLSGKHLTVDYIIPVTVLNKVPEWFVLRRIEREADMAITNIKERLEG